MFFKKNDFYKIQKKRKMAAKKNETGKPTATGDDDIITETPKNGINKSAAEANNTSLMMIETIKRLENDIPAGEPVACAVRGR